MIIKYHSSGKYVFITDPKLYGAVDKRIISEEPIIKTPQINIYVIKFGDTGGVPTGYMFSTLFDNVVHHPNLLICSSQSYHNVEKIEKSNINYELIHRFDGLVVYNNAWGATQIAVIPTNTEYLRRME